MKYNNDFFFQQYHPKEYEDLIKDYTEKCRYCEKKFGGERGSINCHIHETKQHPEKFVTQKIQKAIEMKEASTRVECDYCGLKMRKDMMMAHVGKHVREKKVKILNCQCSFCDRVFRGSRRIRTLRQHQMKVSSTKSGMI